MSLSLETAKNLINIEKQKHDLNAKNIMIPYISTTFSYYIKPDCLNKFNLLICNELYKSFLNFRRIKEKCKEEFEEEVKRKNNLIKSYKDKLVALNIRKYKTKDILDLDIIEGMITQTESKIIEANKEKDTKNKERTEFLTKFNDPEQRQFANEYMRYIICESERASIFKSYEIKELFINNKNELSLMYFYSSMEIYLALYKNQIEYFKNKKSIIDRVV